jgi:hypothetical protein
MLDKYLLILGIFLTVFGTIEVFLPVKIFALWKKWISNRLFFLHGLVLIIIGMPLTCYKHKSVENAIFIIGIVIVFTGPFILFYADKIKHIFTASAELMHKKAIRNIMYFDAAMRIATGSFFIYSYFTI